MQVALTGLCLGRHRPRGFRFFVSPSFLSLLACALLAPRSGRTESQVESEGQGLSLTLSHLTHEHWAALFKAPPGTVFIQAGEPTEEPLVDLYRSADVEAVRRCVSQNGAPMLQDMTAEEVDELLMEAAGVEEEGNEAVTCAEPTKPPEPHRSRVERLKDKFSAVKRWIGENAYFSALRTKLMRKYHLWETNRYRDKLAERLKPLQEAGDAVAGCFRAFHMYPNIRENSKLNLIEFCNHAVDDMCNKDRKETAGDRESPPDFRGDVEAALEWEYGESSAYGAEVDMCELELITNVYEPARQQMEKIAREKKKKLIGVTLKVLVIGGIIAASAIFPPALSVSAPVALLAISAGAAVTKQLTNVVVNSVFGTAGDTGKTVSDHQDFADRAEEGRRRREETEAKAQIANLIEIDATQNLARSGAATAVGKVVTGTVKAAGGVAMASAAASGIVGVLSCNIEQALAAHRTVRNTKYRARSAALMTVKQIQKICLENRDMTQEEFYFTLNEQKRLEAESEEKVKAGEPLDEEDKVNVVEEILEATTEDVVEPVSMDMLEAGADDDMAPKSASPEEEKEAADKFISGCELLQRRKRGVIGCGVQVISDRHIFHPSEKQFEYELARGKNNAYNNFYCTPLGTGLVTPLNRHDPEDSFNKFYADTKITNLEGIEETWIESPRFVVLGSKPPTFFGDYDDDDIKRDQEERLDTAKEQQKAKPEVQQDSKGFLSSIKRGVKRIGRAVEGAAGAVKDTVMSKIVEDGRNLGKQIATFVHNEGRTMGPGKLWVNPRDDLNQVGREAMSWGPRLIRDLLRPLLVSLRPELAATLPKLVMNRVDIIYLGDDAEYGTDIHACNMLLSKTNDFTVVGGARPGGNWIDWCFILERQSLEGKEPFHFSTSEKIVRFHNFVQAAAKAFSRKLISVSGAARVMRTDWRFWCTPEGGDAPHPACAALDFDIKELESLGTRSDRILADLAAKKKTQSRWKKATSVVWAHSTLDQNDVVAHAVVENIEKNAGALSTAPRDGATFLPWNEGLRKAPKGDEPQQPGVGKPVQDTLGKVLKTQVSRDLSELGGTPAKTSFISRGKKFQLLPQVKMDTN